LLHIAIYAIPLRRTHVGTDPKYESFEVRRPIFEVLFKYGFNAKSIHLGVTAWEFLCLSGTSLHFDGYLIYKFLKQGANPNVRIYLVDENIIHDFLNGELSREQVAANEHDWVLTMHRYIRVISAQEGPERFEADNWGLARELKEWFLEFLQIFIENGANPWLTDSDGTTIVEAAREIDPAASEFLINLYATHNPKPSELRPPKRRPFTGGLFRRRLFGQKKIPSATVEEAANNDFCLSTFEMGGLKELYTV